MEKIFDIGKFFYIVENLDMSGKMFLPLKWYTDRNFFGDGGGVGVGARFNQTHP